MKVTCVLKKSDEYDTDYVEHLRSCVEKHCDLPFQCIETDKWPGWWSKMSLFHPQVKGDLLYFDLDTVIVGPLADIAAAGRLTVLDDFNVRGKLASGVMLIPEHERPAIWEAWIKDPQGHMKEHGGHGDGGFLAKFWRDAQRWQDVVPGQIVSYKNSVRGRGIPDGARVVCFHGKPRPRDVQWRL